MSNLHQQYRKVEALDSYVLLFREQHERLDFITERRCTELLKKKNTIWLSREQPNYIFSVNY